MLKHGTRDSMFLMLIAVLLATDAFAQNWKDEGPLTCPMGRNYWISAPTTMDKHKTYWLFVVTHGYKGNGNRAFRLRGSFQSLGDVIIVAPSFPNGYQMLHNGSGQQLVGLFAALRTQYKLYPKLFITGGSGGAQFAHRFAMTYHRYTVGCAAHRGGTWAHRFTGNPDMPFFVSCGYDDTAKSFPSAPMIRIDWAQVFFRQMVSRHCLMKHRYWKTNHKSPNKRGEANGAKECFRLATTGLFASQHDVVAAEIARIRAIATSGQLDEAIAAAKELGAFGVKELGRKPKDTIVALMTPEQREKLHPNSGAGGKSSNGREYWIDDSQENEAGWRVTRSSMRAVHTQRKQYLAYMSAVLIKQCENAHAEEREP